MEMGGFLEVKIRWKLMESMHLVLEGCGLNDC